MKPYALRSLSLLAGQTIRVLRALPVLALVLIVGGCEKKEPAPDEKVLFQAVQNNADALNRKDIDAVMATIHPKAKSFESTRGVVEDMFKKVTLKFTMSDLKVKDASPEQAHVSFVQKTEQVGGDRTIPLNILEGVDTLRPDDGKWKIFDTLVTKTTRLNEGAASSTEPGTPSPEPPAAAAAPGAAATPAPSATPASASTPAAAETKPAAPDQKAPAPADKPPQ